ncbi:antitoxin [Nocardioides baekrokdamisoli]|uniref:Antitoxin n=1 Tax=Nocardioides baekrokdamisoli TaxID=1804624 RepID=A0A3G9IKX4_9ACTN|nr:type II toxin-antitoxin system prevent-host-death family antitoxin [Nocardioides baekrokdamisoli]BBH16715.1 antitoxin [Nocardioides baekrokdamisoli]
MSTTVASRDLRNHTAEVIRRVRDGETVTITVHGEAVAEVVPVRRKRPDFFYRHEVIAMLDEATADRGLLDDLNAMGDESTDDLGPL